jgi:transglutaminase-like putative cysteine protease
MRILCLFLISSVIAAAAPRVPAWAQPWLKHPPEVSTADADAVALFVDRSIEHRADGRSSIRLRTVIKILSKEGASHARSAVYHTSGDKITTHQAWWVSPNQNTISLGKAELSDRPLIDNALNLFSESRLQSYNAERYAAPHGYFIAESVVESRLPELQLSWSPRLSIPVESHRFTLRYPADWKLTTLELKGELPTPEITPTSAIWTARALTPLAREANTSVDATKSETLAINLESPPDLKVDAINRIYGTWSAIAPAVSELYAQRAVQEPALRAKAAELTKHATTPAEKIAALAEYVQGINYISISMDLKRGGGFIPRPAARVLADNFGDCKDKANLLCAMLRSLGIEAFPVSVFSGNAYAVQPEWVALNQFNHCILAIHAPDADEVPALQNHPQLGKLIYFDPTDPHTPLGYLPGSLYASNGLIIAPQHGDLVELPLAPTPRGGTTHHVELELDSTGSVAGFIRETYSLANAQSFRSFRADLNAQKLQEAQLRWMSQSLANIVIAEFTAQDLPQSNQFELSTQFVATNYGRSIRNRLLVFRPSTVPWRNFPSFTEKDRVHPVMLSATHFSENTKVTIPEGFAVDELPENTEIESPYGRYRSSTQHEGRTITHMNEITLHPLEVPAAEYRQLQKFFESIHAAEQRSVVLARQ